MNLGKEELTRRIKVHSEIIEPITVMPRASNRKISSPVWQRIEAKQEELRLQREYKL